MFVAAAMYWVANALSVTVNIRNVCVMLAPIFAGNTALVTYQLAKEARDEATGLLAAALISIVPGSFSELASGISTFSSFILYFHLTGYISRSVAGSFDNEGIAIFALLLTYWFWVKAVKTGSLMWAAMCALAYYFMVLLFFCSLSF
jgi:dolichyl-diphosphooligosaccharide--protein glycosyltransferase